MDTVDVVVVGGGSSGCVVAAGVAADPSLEVALLERGPSAEAHPETLRADGYKDAFRNDALIWERFTAPQRSVRRPCASYAWRTHTSLTSHHSAIAPQYAHGSLNGLLSPDEMALTP